MVVAVYCRERCGVVVTLGQRWQRCGTRGEMTAGQASKSQCFIRQQLVVARASSGDAAGYNHHGYRRQSRGCASQKQFMEG